MFECHIESLMNSFTILMESQCPLYFTECTFHFQDKLGTSSFSLYCILWTRASELHLENLMLVVGLWEVLKKKKISLKGILGKGMKCIASSSSECQHLGLFLLTPVCEKESETLLEIK